MHCYPGRLEIPGRPTRYISIRYGPLLKSRTVCSTLGLTRSCMHETSLHRRFCSLAIKLLQSRAAQVLVRAVPAAFSSSPLHHGIQRQAVAVLDLCCRELLTGHALDAACPAEAVAPAGLAGLSCALPGGHAAPAGPLCFGMRWRAASSFLPVLPGDEGLREPAVVQRRHHACKWLLMLLPLHAAWKAALRGCWCLQLQFSQKGPCLAWVHPQAFVSCDLQYLSPHLSLAEDA